MDAPTTLAGSRAVIGQAVGVLESLRDLLHSARGEELAELVTLCDTVGVVAAQARTAAVVEAVRRDEVTTTVPGWIREHAPSLRQGGAQQVARLVAEVTRGSGLGGRLGGGLGGGLGAAAAPGLGTGAVDGLDAERPIEIVWAATQGSPMPPGSEAGEGEDLAAPDDEAGAAAEGDAGDVFAQARRGGESSARVRPVLTSGSALAVLSEIRALEPRLRPEAVPTVTAALIDLCLQWGPAHMRRLRPRLLAEFGVEGELDELHERLARGSFLTSPPVESGSLTEYRMALTPTQAATLEAALGPLSAPAPNRDTGERDLRPAGQRRAEALTDLCRAAIALHTDADRGAAAGAYATVHVTMTLADLRRSTGATEAWPGSTQSFLSGEVLASTATGTLLSPEGLRLVACAADVIPHVLGPAGEVLDQGRQLRLFNRGHRCALARRDRHCTYPGCDRPAAWTRAHHVLHWWDGGTTSLDNAALLCERHHTVVHSRRLIAEVSSTPDRDGRCVVWDLTPGSYDRELDRRRAARAAHDPPSLTPARLRQVLTALHSSDRHDRVSVAMEKSPLVAM